MKVLTALLDEEALRWVLQNITGAGASGDLLATALRASKEQHITATKVEAVDGSGWIARKHDHWATASGSSAELAIARCHITFVKGHFVDVPQEHLKASIAQAFISGLREKIPPRFGLICTLNRDEKDPNICHSHDFIDANMIMAAAITQVTGFEVDVQDDAHRAVWNASWDMAKQDMLNYSRFEHLKNELIELNELLLNWNGSQLSDDGEQIICYPGRDGAFTQGDDGGCVVIPHQELLDWLASSAPLDATVYGTQARAGSSWELLVSKARKLCSISTITPAQHASEQDHDAPG